MEFKANNWLDTNDRSIHYGIDGSVDGEWLHISSDGKPLFFPTAEERDAKMKELRKQK
jgi:hypothetical protein